MDDAAEKARAVRAAHDVSMKLKAAKLSCVQNHVWCSIETFYDSPESFKGVFDRNLTVVKLAARQFAEKMRQDLSV